MTQAAKFSTRHIGPQEADQREMLKTLGIPSLETLIAQTIPAPIRFHGALNLPEALSEADALEELRIKLDQNKPLKSFIGQGYHGTNVPPVILRNLFENPAWYTAYTPYQAEISQGRLEMLFHFQTLVCELTGLDVASASLARRGHRRRRSRRSRRAPPQKRAQPHRHSRRAASADRRCAQHPRRADGPDH